MELKNKTILITGANGLVGIPTVEKCIAEGASRVIAVDIRIGDKLQEIKNQFSDIVSLEQVDLTYLDQCEQLFKDRTVDVVLHIAGVKGSPARAANSPADYLFPMLMFNTNIIKAAHQANVGWFVYMSSVGVYQPSDVMREDDVWKTMPGKNDWYPGWTKRMGELSLEALGIQYGWKNWTIIRPANIYGLYDNFSPEATVIASNTWKAFNVDGDEMVCWGDGSPKRDFVFSEDVAQAALDVVKKEVNDVINFGSATATSIRAALEILVAEYEKITGKKKKLVWDTTKPNGDMIRRLDPEKQIKYGILPKTSLSDGLAKTLKNYNEQK
jgi:GDP-L-fucose synthase